VVRETLQLDAAGACLFSYLLKSKRHGYSDGLSRACALHAPAHCTVSRDPLSSASSPFPYLCIEVAMVMIAFVGIATFDKPGTGATSILQAVIWVSPKRQLRNVTLTPSCSYYASCAGARGGCACTRTLVMTYRVPGTQVSLPIVVSTRAKKPFYVQLRGAEEGSLLPLLLCRWLSLACSSHPPRSNNPPTEGTAQKA
jgi:hypothetical protein